MRVYHFTNREFGLESIRNRNLKISRLKDLNDPFELFALELSDKNMREAFIRTKDQIDANRGMLCFSDAWSNPVMWSHYAEKHFGLCLEFEIPVENLVKVQYSSTRLRHEVFNVGNENEQIAEAAMLACLSTKFSHWKYESEWRAFMNLEDPGKNGHYFAEYGDRLRLTGIIVGARSTLSRFDQAKRYLIQI